MTNVPILSGTTLTSPDGSYNFTYTIVNPESGMIFYKAQKVQPQSVPTPITSPQDQNSPILLPPPLPVRDLPRRIPLGRPAPAMNGISRANLWLMLIWGSYKFGEMTFETNQNNIKNMNENETKAYLDAIMMYN